MSKNEKVPAGPPTRKWSLWQLIEYAHHFGSNWSPVGQQLHFWAWIQQRSTHSVLEDKQECPPQRRRQQLTRKRNKQIKLRGPSERAGVRMLSFVYGGILCSGAQGETTPPRSSLHQSHECNVGGKKKTKITYDGHTSGKIHTPAVEMTQ